MNAAVLWEIGKAPKWEEFEEPEAGEGEAVVRVRAASLKPVDKQLASGAHFASPREADLPVICGTDGVGDLEDGTRVFFGGCRKPFGAMAELTVVPRAFCFALPAGIDDDTAAALANPGVSAWVSLTHRAKLARGETVLILGATGVAGQLAVQIAKLLGAKRVVGVGRNERVLVRLGELGTDATIQLDQSAELLRDAYVSEMREAGSQGFRVCLTNPEINKLHLQTLREPGFDVVLDYLWGEPTEALLAVLSKSEFAVATRETRLVQVGESAGATITLPAAVLRSAPVTILGTGGIPPYEILTDAMKQVMERGARGELRIETERVALEQIENVWKRAGRTGSRIVVVP
jgi:NADPH:quinone reductase-like Zn-dependent oxidoreductase